MELKNQLITAEEKYQSTWKNQKENNRYSAHQLGRKRIIRFTKSYTASLDFKQ